MSKILLEIFLPEQPAPAGNRLIQLLKEIEQEYRGKVEIKINTGHNAAYEEYNLSALPALFVGDFVRFIGVCPDKESLLTALRESGLE